MTAVESSKAAATNRRPQIWPLSLKAYHALGEMGLIPENTELLYGQVFQKMSKSPRHCVLFMRLLELLQRAVPPGLHVRPEQPIICGDSEPEPDLAVIRGEQHEFAARHPSTAALVIEVAVTSAAEDRSLASLYAEAGVTEVRSMEDVAPLLFPHTAYKSYPEGWLMEEKWDRMTKWLGTVSSHPIKDVDLTDVAGCGRFGHLRLLLGRRLRVHELYGQGAAADSGTHR